ncbi:MAG TPA: type II secretion system F family protein [Syntrophorhabdaceae bacterium]|nr:type II secretion system F family protein [Syntrophorhabdaceae bacterium]
MSSFTYKARDDRGLLVTGTMEAATKNDIFAQLDNMGLLPISAKESGRTNLDLNNVFLRFQRVKSDDLIFFTRQLQTVIKSGIPLVRGLKALEEQTNNERLRGAISDIIQDIDKGQSLSDAFSKHKGIFSEIYIGMVRAGEIGGSLEDVLGRISDLIEFQMKTREIVKSATRYPIFVLVTLAIAFVVLIKMVVPKFAPIFKSSKVALPLPTQILLLINDLLQNYSLIVLGVIFLIFAGFFYYRKTKTGALAIDKFMLSIPLIGSILQKISMSRFAFILENLIKVGIPIIQTLDIVSRAVGNRYIAGKIQDVAESIEKGRGISAPLKKARIFPPLVIHLIATGEETGSLEEMLREISVHYDREVSYSVGRLSAWIEPLLTVFLAGMVLFLALAIFMPWWNMMSVLKGGG